MKNVGTRVVFLKYKNVTVLFGFSNMGVNPNISLKKKCFSRPKTYGICWVLKWEVPVLRIIGSISDPYSLITDQDPAF